MLLYDAKVYCLQNCLKDYDDLPEEEKEKYNIDEFIEWTDKYNSDGKLSISKDILEEDVNRTITELETYYVKQVHVLGELKEFYDEERFSMNDYREDLPIDSLTELSSITKELLEAHRDSSKRLLSMIELDESK